MTGFFFPSKRPSALWAALLLALPTACEKKTPPPAPAGASDSRDSNPARVLGKSPAALLQALHHAAQEMALDGFQFDKPGLGWPRDRGSRSASDHLQALASRDYLSPGDLAFFADIDIANLGDSDPGESAFAKIPTRGETLVIRKDGQLATDAATGATLWLPR